jgi:hypothetical protein
MRHTSNHTIIKKKNVGLKVNPDHPRQVQVWDVINLLWNKKPFQVC